MEDLFERLSQLRKDLADEHRMHDFAFRVGERPADYRPHNAERMLKLAAEIDDVSRRIVALMV